MEKQDNRVVCVLAYCYARIYCLSDTLLHKHESLSHFKHKHIGKMFQKYVKYGHFTCC